MTWGAGARRLVAAGSVIVGIGAAAASTGAQALTTATLRVTVVDPSDAVIVGDRVSTDIAMSGPLGMASVLVLSGATSADELEHSPARPDYVINGLADLLPAEARHGLPEGSSR